MQFEWLCDGRVGWSHLVMGAMIQNEIHHQGKTTVALWTMSDARVSWMVAVFRAAVRRNDC